MGDNLDSQLMDVIRRTDRPTNILFVGATGSGKSSTINALFNSEKAKIGFGADPETKNIAKYELGENVTLWDSPGLGDSKENDKEYSKNIASLLQRMDDNGNTLIDLVVVIADNSSRNLGTVYQLISNVIVPNLAEADKNRIVIALNKTDLLAGGMYWNREDNRPEPKLEPKIVEKEESVRNRVYNDTKVNPKVISYASGFSDEEISPQPWQLIRLLSEIIAAVPPIKRITVMNMVNQDSTVWENDENYDHYKTTVKNNLADSIVEIAESVGEKVPILKPLTTGVKVVTRLVEGFFDFFF
ncbi:GTPase family protein [Weissella confusa]|nr:GTPase [Weissella confusa]